MKRWITVIALALVLGLVAGNAEAAKGAKAAKGAGKAGKGDKPVVGTVVKVDGTNLVIQTKGKNAAEVTIATDANTVVEIKGAKGALADLKAGMQVQATPNTGTATKVIAGGGGKGDKAAKKAKKAK